MKILLVSLFHPELVRGGAQQICYELFEGLRETPDVDAYFLAAVDEQMSALYKSGARITGFDQRPNEYVYLSRDYDYLWHKAGNPLLVAAFAEFLELIRPDVVHFHHFLLLGIDLLTVTRRTLPRVRLVFTFHEFLAICDANGHMVRTTDRSLCEFASPVRCHQCFPTRGPEHFFMRELWIKQHLKNVDAFTTPSRFMIKHYERWGLPADKIHYVANGQKNYGEGRLVPDVQSKHNRFGFFGQFVDVKGVHLLIRAAQRLQADGFTDFVIELNGDNLQYASQAVREELEAFLRAEQERPFTSRNVVMNGSYQVSQLGQRMARVDWCIVPSIWWEAFGLVISEALMFKKPVIVSNVGGPAERIRHGLDGLHFEMGDAAALAGVIRRACIEQELWQKLVMQMKEAPNRNTMVRGFLEVYRSRGQARAIASSHDDSHQQNVAHGTRFSS
jgi:glycosyltransferase involved in cell wall biosynthesis